MKREIIKWITVGYAVLLVITTVTPLVMGQDIKTTNDNGLLGEEERSLYNLKGDRLQPRWDRAQHVNITEIAAKKVKWISDDYIKILSETSKYPDDFDPDFTPFIQLLNKLGILEHTPTPEWTLVWGNSHQYLHAYFPNPTTVTIEDLEGKKHTFSSGTGGAHERCQYYYEKAMECFNNGQHEDAFKYLGYATHFLQDVGNVYIAIN